MKKTYQKPETMTVKVQPQALLSVSQPEAGFNLNDLGTTNATSGNLGKERGSRTADDFDDLW